MAWEDSEISSSSNEEQRNLVFIASHNTAYDEDEVSDCELNDKPSYEELHNAFYELNEECLILSRKCSKQKN